MGKIKLTLFLLWAWGVTGLAQTYSLSEKSTLSIDGTSTLRDWTVTANTMDGELKSEGTSPKELDFEVQVVDIKSERGSTMDTKTHRALKHEKHPKVTFKLKEVKDDATMIGTLDIAGVEKEVEINTAVTASGQEIKIKGEKAIRLQDYDIEPPSAMFGQIVVGDEVVVKFDLVFAQ